MFAFLSSELAKIQTARSLDISVVVYKDWYVYI